MGTEPSLPVSPHPSCQLLQSFVLHLGPAMGKPFLGRQRAVEGGVYQHSPPWPVCGGAALS